MGINWKQKLSSRKFWAAVSAVVISIMVMFGVDSGEQERTKGAIMATGTLICYILTEGAADVANIKKDDK